MSSLKVKARGLPLACATVMMSGAVLMTCVPPCVSVDAHATHAPDWTLAVSPPAAAPCLQSRDTVYPVGMAVEDTGVQWSSYPLNV